MCEVYSPRAVSNQRAHLALVFSLSHCIYLIYMTLAIRLLVTIGRCECEHHNKMSYVKFAHLRYSVYNVVEFLLLLLFVLIIFPSFCGIILVISRFAHINLLKSLPGLANRKWKMKNLQPFIKLYALRWKLTFHFTCHVLCRLKYTYAVTSAAAAHNYVQFSCTKKASSVQRAFQCTWFFFSVF